MKKTANFSNSIVYYYLVDDFTGLALYQWHMTPKGIVYIYIYIYKFNLVNS